MNEYWLVPNKMFAISHIVEVNRLKRVLRRLGLGYENVQCTVQGNSKKDAAKKFEGKGFNLGYYSAYASHNDPEAARSKAPKKITCKDCNGRGGTGEDWCVTCDAKGSVVLMDDYRYSS